MFAKSFLHRVSLYSSTHVASMLQLPSLKCGVRHLAAPMPACAAVLQQHRHQQQHARPQAPQLPSLVPQLRQLSASRHICNSTAAKAPVIKPKWDTETARKALASLADEPTEFARGVEVLDSIVKVYTVYSRYGSGFRISCCFPALQRVGQRQQSHMHACIAQKNPSRWLQPLCS